MIQNETPFDLSVTWREFLLASGMSASQVKTLCPPDQRKELSEVKKKNGLMRMSYGFNDSGAYGYLGFGIYHVN